MKSHKENIDVQISILRVTYLENKHRIISKVSELPTKNLNDNERSAQLRYHDFYPLCAGSGPQRYPKLQNCVT